MKNILFAIVVILAFAACRKNNDHTEPVHTIIHVDASLKAAFGYKPGTYWIYKDSISGQIDSAYVAGYTTSNAHKGCVMVENQDYFESIIVSIKLVNSNPADSERWDISLADSTTFGLHMYNVKGVSESELNFQPFTFPFAPGNSTLKPGCLAYIESACASDVIPLLTINAQNFLNTTLLNHCSLRNATAAYNDRFYTHKDAGFIKVSQHHGTTTFRRVLELQRCNIVR